jgi:type I restriction enzyme S subunit
VSRIGELISEHCPDGVEFKTLGEVGKFIRGNGLQKKDFVDEGFPCIHYGQIYTFYGTSTATTKSFVAPGLAAGLKQAEKGDLVVTTTSENIEDVCTAVAWLGDSPIAIGGHSCIYRHALDPMYAAYYFQTEQFEIQKRKLVTGTKVKEIKVSDVGRIKIPVPPPEVQQEIVEILGRTEMLTAELEAELEAEIEDRSRQFAYYRDSLLTFANSERVRWATLSDIGYLYNGLSGKSKIDFQGGNARFVPYVHVFNKLSLATLPDTRVKIGENERQNRVRYGDVLFTASSESVAEVGMSSGVTVEPAEPLYLNSFCFGFRPNDANELNPEFANHLFRSNVMRRQIIKTANGVTRINISKEPFRAIKLPIPEPAEQERIADLLNRFEALVDDISVGLPGEIGARRQQYEFYRDRLFSFEEKAQ